MSVTQLKEEILSMLSEVNDEGVLLEVADRLRIIGPASLVELSQNAQAAVMAAIAEDDAGQTHSHAEVMANAWQLIADFEKKQSNVRA